MVLSWSCFFMYCAQRGLPHSLIAATLYNIYINNQNHYYNDAFAMLVTPAECEIIYNFLATLLIEFDAISFILNVIIY